MNSGAVVAAALVSVLSIAGVTALALNLREGPARCPDGLVRAAGRCCGVGQQAIGGRCAGKAKSCADGQSLDAQGSCVRPSERVRIQGEFVAAPGGDWESSRTTTAKMRVHAFEIDGVETTGARYAECVAAQSCTAVSAADDPTLPVRNVTPEQAQAFCRWASGRVPSGGEWMLAAAGKTGRRFPWGSTGLVCRRAAFGLADGPCATGGVGPDTPGSRPDGATPEGVLDLSGNVAEWTIEADGSVRARGGSYLSRGAAELKTWSAEERKTAAPHIGFRCVYPLPDAD